MAIGTAAMHGLGGMGGACRRVVRADALLVSKHCMGSKRH